MISGKQRVPLLSQYKSGLTGINITSHCRVQWWALWELQCCDKNSLRHQESEFGRHLMTKCERMDLLFLVQKRFTFKCQLNVYSKCNNDVYISDLICTFWWRLDLVSRWHPNSEHCYDVQFTHQISTLFCTLHCSLDAVTDRSSQHEHDPTRANMICASFRHSICGEKDSV